jgi:nicotinate phosphoribosyltransferase
VSDWDHWYTDKRIILELGDVSLSPKELEFLKKECSYLNYAYLGFLESFRFKPEEHINVTFDIVEDTGSDDDVGEVHVAIKGLWVETILYEIPILALTSEAYFRFCDKDWTYNLQEEKAAWKGHTLLQNGCVFSEFGTRRRRNYKTQDIVMAGLIRASHTAKEKGWKGQFTGTSNVHFAMKYGVAPVGTVAHEWYMAIAAITDDYENASEMALRYWLACFGQGVCD